MQVSEAFLKIVELAKLDGVSSIRDLPGLWTRKVDDEWSIAVNGHDKKIDGVPAFTAKIVNSKYLAIGFVNPSGGTMVGGTEAEDDFILACDRALRFPSRVSEKGE